MFFLLTSTTDRSCQHAHEDEAYGRFTAELPWLELNTDMIDTLWFPCTNSLLSMKVCGLHCMHLFGDLQIKRGHDAYATMGQNLGEKPKILKHAAYVKCHNCLTVFTGEAHLNYTLKCTLQTNIESFLSYKPCFLKTSEEKVLKEYFNLFPIKIIVVQEFEELVSVFIRERIRQAAPERGKI